MHTDRKRIVGYTHEETLDAIYRAVKSRHAEISLTERDRLCGIYMFEVRKEIKKEGRKGRPLKACIRKSVRDLDSTLFNSFESV